ncbi:fibrous sheath-interacting protein 2-like isoform X1 [Anguilla anguilla]|uniref:fibrous sheath-interacting protein 2-like isoform X1 n=2 Tax=Anguilla anguilla TaxID=7936 RepID=UPI0015B0B2CE|nr:fibrous sheath-interacting protein 2-like isoform X1 [Anguilla anguilla]
MEMQLPKINTIVLQDGTSAPFQLTRRRISTDKLPVPTGARLTLTRGQLGDGLYRPTTEFLRTGPCMRIPDPIYNNLHDPHLRHYYHRQDRRNMLKEGNFVTDDNEVICSLKDYNTYEEYLRRLKMVANKTYDQTQSAKMEKVMRLQKKGRVPRDVRLEEVMESILEEDSENMRKLLQTEAAKRKQKGQTEVEDENRRLEEALYTELDLLSWTAEDRSRLALHEKQYRHEQNREIYMREVREQKDRRKQALVSRKCSTNQRKLQEKIQMSKEAELRRHKAEGREGSFWELPSGEPQCLLPSRPRARGAAPRSGAARVYGVTASEVFQKLPTIQRTGANDRRTLPERKAKASRESAAVAGRKADLPDEELGEPSPGSDPQGLLPLRPRLGRPALRSGAGRVYAVRASDAFQKLPSLESSKCSDQ